MTMNNAVRTLLLQAPKRFHEVEPLFTFNFSTGASTGAKSISDLVTVRADARLMNTSAGVWSSVGVDTLRRSDAGILSEAITPQSIRNPTGSGAVAGSPGTSPTNWVVSTTSNGVTKNMVASGTENGIPYASVRYSGTPAINFAHVIIFETATGVPAEQHQAWASQLVLKILAGALADGVTFRLNYQELTSGGAVAGTPDDGLIIEPTIGASYGSEVFSEQLHVLNADAAYIRNFLQINYTQGVPVDFTMRMCPNLYQLPLAPPAPILAAATRAGDMISLDYSLPASGGIRVVGTSPAGDWDTNTLWSADDGSADNSIRIERDEARMLHAIMTTAAAVEADLLLGFSEDGAQVEVRLAWTPTTFTAKLTGELVRTASVTSPSGVDTLRFGSSVAGVQWNDYITAFDLYGTGFRILGEQYAASEWRQGAILGYIPDDVLVASTAALTCMETWHTLRFTVDASEVRLSYVGYWVDVDNVENNPGNDQQIEVAIRYPAASGNVVQKAVEGSLIGTLQNGQVEALTGVWLPSDFGVAQFDEGETFRVQTRRVVPLGGSHTINYMNRITADKAITHDGSVASQLLSSAASMTTLPGSTTGSATQLPAVVAVRPLTSNVAVGMSGLSLAEGYGDNQTSATGLRDDIGGAEKRALSELNFAQINFARGGTAAIQWLHGAATKRAPLFRYCTHGTILQGINDVGEFANAYECLGAQKYIARLMQFNGIGMVVPGIMPAIGGWHDTPPLVPFSDIDHQFPATNCEIGGSFRDVLNFEMLATSTSFFGAVYDWSPATCDSVRTDLWKCDGGIPRTQDGAHCLPLGYAEAQPLCVATFETFAPP